MKKYITILLVLFFFTLTSCEETPEEQGNEWTFLPDLNNSNETEVIEILNDLNVNYEIKYNETSSAALSSMFIMYQDRNIGDIINLDDLVIVLVYPKYNLGTVLLPDLSGLDRSFIITLLDVTTFNYYFEEVNTNNEELDDDFIEYSNDYEAGDSFNLGSAVGIKIYHYEETSEGYFVTVELEYDGPYLDSIYEDIDYINPRGGYFDVTLSRCTDGDTAKFVYPTDIYDAIRSSAKSTRFLNMDTQETYSGGEEEWGKPGSIYTCGLLEAATSIIIQTDPDDGLLGTYGRLLGWVWIQLPNEDEYFLLNYMVVKQGLAEVKFEFGAGETLSYDDKTYNEWMHYAEDYAINNNLGQWGNSLDYYWNYVTDEPYYDRWN